MSEKTITTVLGDIAPESLGTTSMHEHIMYSFETVRSKAAAVMPPLEESRRTIEPRNFHYARNNVFMYEEIFSNHDEELAYRELVEFKKAGGDSMVDASASECHTRRDVEALKSLSERTGVNIVCSTGMYLFGQRHGKFLSMTEDQMVHYYMDEIENGIMGTGVKPGVIKAAIQNSTDDGSCIPEELVPLSACARVAAATGYGIEVHTDLPLPTDSVVKAIKMVIERGVDPAKIHVCHIDNALCLIDPDSYIHDEGTVREPNYDRALRILDLGVTIGFDTCGNNRIRDMMMYTDDYDRLRALNYLIGRGYADQIVLGQDLFPAEGGVYAGSEGYCRILNFIKPKLAQYHVCSEEDARKLFIDNPKRILSHAK